MLFLIIGLALGALLGVLFMRNKTGLNPLDFQKEMQLEKEKAGLAATLQEQLKQMELLVNEKEQYKNAVDSKDAELNAVNIRIVKAEEAFRTQREKLEEKKIELEALQSTLTKEFENIANKILDEKSHKFTEQNKNNLDVILSPLKDRIKDFEEKVDRSYKNEAAERNTLKGSIEELMKFTNKISVEATNLTNALKGDSKKQGNWGELVLERILESSGLIEGQNYTLQGKGLNLKDEDGNRFQPDVIINLPDNKHIVIDAKVSLVAYEKLVNENTEEGRDKFIKEHLLSIKTHITGLSNKNYHDLYGINSPDYVLLFVPIESSFSIAIQHAQDLFDFAWSKRVVLVTPSTLFATLKTVASIWKQEQQSKNAIEIATKAGALYDKFVGFTEDMKRIGSQISNTQKTYEEAFGKLHTGRGSLTSSVENLKKLGAKASKQLDKNLVDEEDNLTALE
jgi:DNA recombination protein RmuC